MSLSAGARLGPYEILTPLGAGGMGEVYRARDTRLEREVAIKVLPAEFSTDPGRLKRFETEARAASALNHPNIITIYEIGSSDSTSWIAMERVEGPTLRELLFTGPLPIKRLLSIATQMAEGLARAHGAGIVHRDLKPENVMVTGDGLVKILDFGLAKLTATDRGDAQPSRLPTDTGTSPGVVLGTVGYMSPEQASGQPIDFRSDQFSFGSILYEMATGRRAFQKKTGVDTLAAILHEEPESLEKAAPSVFAPVRWILERCLAKDPAERYDSTRDLARELATCRLHLAGSAALDKVEQQSPYPGLTSFTEKDVSVFFGREEEVKAVWEKLRGRRLLAVIGHSGAGKTSFVRAGVVVGRPDGWAAIACTPGRAPLKGLGQALGPELSGDPESLRKIAGFEDPETAFELLVRWRRSHRDALVVVDQFEELFTLNDSETQARFAALLGRFAREADGHVLLSLRDDFLMQCHDHAALSPVFDALTPLGEMTREPLRRAIVEPAKKRGYRFEDDALVNEMVETLERARAALPLLAFAVSRLWETRDRERKRLTRQAYEEIGGVAGALAQHAEATLDRIGSERQNLVREIFRNLVTAEGTRAVSDREELLSVFPDRAAAEAVLSQLIDARLLTSYEVDARDGETGCHRVEIVHESLLRAWPRLVRWQTQDADGAQLRDQLRQAAHLWEERGKTEDLLWTGASFLDFRAWRERYPGGLSAVEEDFATSMAALAGRKKRRRRIAVAAIVAVLAAGLGIVAALWRRSEVQARRAEASKLLAVAQLKLQEDPTEALAFTTASLELSDTKEARLMAIRALQEAPPAWEALSGFRYAAQPTFSEDGRQLAVAGFTPIVGIWSENGGPPILLPDHDVSPRGPNVAAWVSDKLLVTGLLMGTGRRVQVWSMPAGTKLRTIDFGASSRWQIGHGRLFAMTEVASSAGALDLRSWRLPDGEPEFLGRVDAAKLGMTSAAFEPHGRGWFYTVGTTTHFLPLPMGRGGDQVFSRHAAKVKFYYLYGRPGLVGQRDEQGENRLLFFPENGPPVTTILPKPASAPQNVWFTTSTRWIVNYPGDEARLRLWETTALPGARPLELRREGSWYESDADLAHAGRLAVATTHNWTRLTFWRLPAVRGSVVDGYKSAWRPLAFSPDGKWLATSWEDGRLRLWPLPGSESSELKVLNTPAVQAWTSLVFDPGGKYLFAVGNLDNAWIFPLDGSPGRRLNHFSDDTLLYGAAVSPSGQRVATAFGFGKGPKTLRVWDVETGSIRLFDLPQPPAPPGSTPGAPVGDAGGVESLAFLDESTVLTAGDGGIRRWNLDTGTHELIRPLAFDRTEYMCLSSDRHEVLFCEAHVTEPRTAVSCGVIELATGTTRSLGGASFGRHAGVPPEYLKRFGATEGPAVALMGTDGSVRIGLRSGGEPHWLLGHAGMPNKVAISPDLRWVASSGEDNTLRLWPMPDLSKPPLQTLPHDELIAKLKSLTNLRAVRDATSATGWKIEVGPFPGWKNLPTWQP
jgi:serine/threonine protein kinase/WD40 repeat protein